MKWVLLGLALAMAGWWFGPQLFGECRNAPKIVAYTPGMTLCPGQTAVMPLVIPLSRPPAVELEI
jgi:hypothetical protein